MSYSHTPAAAKLSHATLQKLPTLRRKSDNKTVAVVNFLAGNSRITTYHIQSVEEFGTNAGLRLTFAQVQAEYALLPLAAAIKASRAEATLGPAA